MWTVMRSARKASLFQELGRSPEDQPKHNSARVVIRMGSSQEGEGFPSGLEQPEGLGSLVGRRKGSDFWSRESMHPRELEMASS
mmetsp:Transcript_11147/g.22160  ORF Transcript_11147/g.22160 Transcript_11147/m.22160 type:complete len:84 (+) Transcript_11147:549-800(+)